MELGWRAYYRQNYEHIKSPGRWGNKEFLTKSGNDIHVEVTKTREGARLEVKTYIFTWLRSLLYYLEEMEYNALRSRDGWRNTIAVEVTSRLVFLLRKLSYYLYRFWPFGTRSYFELQKYYRDTDKEYSIELARYYNCFALERISNITFFLLNADELDPAFVSKNWKHWKGMYYDITPAFVEVVFERINRIKAQESNIFKTISDKIRKSNVVDVGELDYRVLEFINIRRMFINYSMLKKDVKHAKSEESYESVKEYLNELKEHKKEEEARLLARTLQDLINHPRYEDVIVTVIQNFDQDSNKRVQISLDNRYLDLVSIYNKEKNTSYYRVGDLQDIKKLVELVSENTNTKEQVELFDGSKVNKYHRRINIGRGRNITYTNFNNYKDEEKSIAQADVKLLNESGVLQLAPHELKTRYLSMNNNLLICIGFGPVLSRQGHEQAILLEKRIGKNVEVLFNEMKTRRIGILPVLLIVSSCFLTYFVARAIYDSLWTADAEEVTIIDYLDGIGITFGIWLILTWTFTSFSDTDAKIKDLLFRTARFSKVSQLRKHFKLSRKSICKSFYHSDFLQSLVGSGYNCYFKPEKPNGPLQMDVIALFDEVIGRRSLVRKNQLLFQDKDGLRLIKMPTMRNIAHLETRNNRFTSVSGKEKKFQNDTTTSEDEIYKEILKDERDRMKEMISGGKILLDEVFDEGIIRTAFVIGGPYKPCGREECDPTDLV